MDTKFRIYGLLGSRLKNVSGNREVAEMQLYTGLNPIILIIKRLIVSNC